MKGTHRRATAEMGNDNAAGRNLGRHLRQGSGDVFVRQAVEAVAPYPFFMQVPRDGVEIGHIVVIDAETGFGNGRILTAGPLRETIQDGLARADAVVLVGNGAPDLKGFAGPVLRAQLVPVDAPGVAGQRVLAFAGIGRPGKFFATLRSLGAEVVEERAYEDHHAYTASEFARLHARAKAQNASLVTTE